jgi:hypothetical protein
MGKTKFFWEQKLVVLLGYFPKQQEKTTRTTRIHPLSGLLGLKLSSH